MRTKRKYASYSPDDWIRPKIEIRTSPIDGRGMFAKDPIGRGEKVLVMGGGTFSREDVQAGKAAPSMAIDENMYLSEPAGGVSDADFVNHSCDSNLWLADEITFIAKSAIEPGNELTIDYAMFLEDEEHVSAWACRCGTSTCRKSVTGKDWRLPEVQSRYEGHFSPFLNRRIDSLQAAGARPGQRAIANHLDRQGRLTVWPNKRQQDALVYLASYFETDRRYSESEVNALIKTLHTFDDHALLRRELCDRGFLDRTPDGSAYWKKQTG